ncbi:hypothetical protein QBC39DRAFT_256993 [Podospora conica]|nr:hypothetical protein QBC39DRAFT_256993 [Schizothecium conicum]
MTTPSNAAITTKTVVEFASSVDRRARASGPDFDHVAATVRALRKDLGYLHAEARDPESALNHPGASGQGAVYARQLTSIVEDTDFALKQADTILKKYADSGSGPSRRDVDRQERDSKLDLVAKELALQRTKINLFLDTIQLHTPTRNRKALEHASSHELERIKDKVDEVAGRIFRQKAKRSPVDASDDDTWKEFRTELEKEGFSSDVLKKNKEVLRAYIREVESHQQSGNGSPPSVRGLLSHGPKSAPYPTSDGESQHNLLAHVNTRNLDSSIPRSLQPVYHSTPALVNTRSSNLSYEPPTSSDPEDFSPGGTPRTATISTQDLMLMDQRDLEMTARMGSMRLAPGFPLHNYSVSPGTSPTTHYLPAGAQPLMLPGPGHDTQLSASPYQQQFGTSPRYVPPLVPPTSAPPVGSELVPAQPPRQYSRLAPDSEGREIPLDAKWTKIKRSLVSPVVLERAGVRYEARPDFVAVLGVLTPYDIAEFARQSADVRNARHRPVRRPETYRDREQRRAASNSSESDDVLWDSDSSDSDADRKKKRNPKDSKRDSTRNVAVPVIVSPPDGAHDASSPSSTVGPKPILKNRNPNHVRFDGDGTPREIRPGDYRDRSRHRERERSRDDRDRDRDRDRDTKEKDRGERHRDRDRDRDRRRDRDREHRRHDKAEQGRDRERGERGERDDKDKKRSSFKDTFGAAGIGGAAATLLSVLTDAAVHGHL